MPGVSHVATGLSGRAEPVVSGPPRVDSAAPRSSAGHVLDALAERHDVLRLRTLIGHLGLLRLMRWWRLLVATALLAFASPAPAAVEPTVIAWVTIHRAEASPVATRGAARSLAHAGARVHPAVARPRAHAPARAPAVAAIPRYLQLLRILR